MAKNFKDTNAYTLIFATLMVVIVGSLLAYISSTLKPLQLENQKVEKMQKILQSIGVQANSKEAKGLYQEYIKNELAVDAKGNVVAEGTEAFEINLVKEVKLPTSEQKLPLYVAQKDGKTFYVLPLRGNGLWGPIWGYISLNDQKTVEGVVFDHASETPGLGAEITTASFTGQFVGEKIFSTSGSYQGITVKKGNGDPENNDKDDNEVDAIAGATITGDGVTAMIIDRVKLYLPYLSK